MARAGADLALLLLGGFRVLVDAAVSELEELGFPDARPSHEFAMRAIDAGADNASDLGRRMSMSKQAAAKIVETLLTRGYLTREPDPGDARRKRLLVTPRGHQLMTEGERIFDRLRRQFESRIGADELEALERHLSVLVGEHGVRLDEPGSLGVATEMPGS